MVTLCSRKFVKPPCTRGGDTVLHEAVLQFENDIVRHLIYKGANVTAVNTENKNRQPMQEAVLNHNYDAIGSLIEKGADMNTVDDDGNTPLILACRPPSRAQMRNVHLIGMSSIF